MSIIEGNELALVETVIRNVNEHPWRPKTAAGEPGGLVLIPDEAIPVVVGDLHSNLKNLQDILASDGNMEAIHNGTRTLVIIGDTVHNDQTGQMKEMESSVVILEFILSLMYENPKHILYIRGNHDTFDERLVKSGILQGKEFKKTLIAKKGPEYTAVIERFFECLPLCLIGKGFVIVHAGPVRGGITRQELIDIRQYPDKYHQLIWNRVHEFRGNPSAKEYDGKDISAMLAKLGLADNTFFIVGHNPLWGTGDTSGVWQDVVEIRNHIIIYSGSGSKAPFIILQNGSLEIKYAANPVKEVYYYG